MLINEFAKEQIEIWDVTPLSEGKMRVSLYLSDFFSIRPLLKKTSCRMHIVKRTGVPFLWTYIFRRKLFAAGIIIFIVALFALSSLVWDVEVRGNVNIATEDVLIAAKEEGLYPYQWRFRLESLDKLSTQLTRKLSDTSWIGVTRTGTKYVIDVVEATRPRITKLVSPSHLISKADAIVTQIYAERGQPEVSKNDRVRKGSILISGFQGGNTVVAKGEVKGIVWHEYNIEVPLMRKQQVLTGERQEKGYLYFGKTAIQIYGYGKNKFGQSRMMAELNPLRWRQFVLPIGWMSEKMLEMTEIETSMSEKEAKKKGLDQAQNDILTKYGVSSRIIEQKILHEKTESGKVYMKVLFEVEQNIAEELPIVPDQGE